MRLVCQPHEKIRVHRCYGNRARPPLYVRSVVSSITHPLINIEHLARNPQQASLGTVVIYYVIQARDQKTERSKWARNLLRLFMVFHFSSLPWRFAIVTRLSSARCFVESTTGYPRVNTFCRMPIAFLPVPPTSSNPFLCGLYSS